MDNEKTKERKDIMGEIFFVLRTLGKDELKLIYQYSLGVSTKK